MMPSAETKLDYDLATRSGDPLRFIRTNNVEGTNRCFLLDEIAAYLGETKVGYILIENVPADVFGAYCPTAFHFYDRIGGFRFFPADRAGVPFSDLSIEELRFIAMRVSTTLSWPGKNMDHLESLSAFEDWTRTEVEQTSWYRRVRAAYEDFREFHVDKPKIAYVATKGPNQNRGLLDDYSGHGIGLALYQVAAMEVSRSGLDFHLSKSTVSPDAMRMHRFFEKSDWLRIEGDRTILDGMAISESVGFSIRAAAKPTFGFTAV